jgi:hypothetical protein
MRILVPVSVVFDSTRDRNLENEYLVVEPVSKEDGVMEIRACCWSDTSLVEKADETAARVAKLLTVMPGERDPLAQFKPQVRAAYEQMIGFIYDCSTNRSAAKTLVSKILGKLESSSPKSKRTSGKARSRR